MKQTNYAGIDYSPPGSTVNRDSETRIRYGVISRNSVFEGGQEVYDQGTNQTHANWEAEIKFKLRGVFDDYLSDSKWGERKTSDLDDAVEAAFESVEQDLNDRYEEDNDSYRYEKDGYIIETCLDNDFTVIKSPFITYAQYCSPCVPGACNLDSPLEGPTSDGSNCCYCLGHDWFEGGKAPYPVFNMGGAEILNKNETNS